MKKLGLFAATAAVAALLAPSASAQGYLGASYGNVDADTGEAAGAVRSTARLANSMAKRAMPIHRRSPATFIGAAIIGGLAA